MTVSESTHSIHFNIPQVTELRYYTERVYVLYFSISSPIQRTHPKDRQGFPVFVLVIPSCLHTITITLLRNVFVSLRSHAIKGDEPSSSSKLTFELAAWLSNI